MPDKMVAETGVAETGFQARHEGEIDDPEAHSI